MFDIGELNNFAFFALINEFLRSEIDTYAWELLGRFTTLATTVAMALTTMWILYQGFMIISGRSRESMMGLVVSSLRTVLIVFAATSMALMTPGADCNPEGGTDDGCSLYWRATDGLGRAITDVVADTDDPYSEIDKNLALMTVAFGVIESLPVPNAGENGEQEAKDRAQMFTGLGIAGPAVVSSAMMLLFKVAMALFIGFGPLFILCLLFDATKSLFQRWLFYGIGTIFSLSVLVVMVNLTTKLVGAVAFAFVTRWAASTLDLVDAEGLSSMSMQLAGLGLVMTTLILTAPPMAAMFFQGTLATFTPYATMGAHMATGQPQRGGYSGGGYQPPAPGAGGDHGRNAHQQDSVGAFGNQRTPIHDTGEIRRTSGG